MLGRLKDATYNQNMFIEKLLHPYWGMVQKHTQTKADTAIKMRSFKQENPGQDNQQTNLPRNETQIPWKVH